MKISSLGGEAIQIQIDGEDYSVADIVHKELLGIKRVKFAGVAPPHPLIKTLTIQLHTDGVDSNEVLKQAIDNAQERTREILDAVKREFPDAVKPVRARTVAERPSVTTAAESRPEEKTEPAQTQPTPQMTPENAESQTPA
jgi:DNA-directed RNA polymerase subunit L